MVLQTKEGDFLDGRESAVVLAIQYGTFRNNRTERGDGFLVGHELVPGRVFFRAEDVRRLAAERGLL